MMLRHESALLPIPCIFGPTASGKSQLGLALADRWPIEIICVDSATIYQGMDIGTAKPSPSEQAQCPHHLLDILDPANSYSVAAFVEDVHRIIRQCINRQRIPVLLGGTMMYFNALQNGIHELPTADPLVRNTILTRAQQDGWRTLYAEIAAVDPVTAARFSPNDTQRIQRALEIMHLTGKTVSELYAEPKMHQAQTNAYVWKNLSLEVEQRAWLHDRIYRRLVHMVETGFSAEVATLFSRSDLHINLPSIRCVGYRQAWESFEQQRPLDDLFLEAAATATRQLAKRQITWQRSVQEKTRIFVDTNPRSIQDTIDWFAENIVPYYLTNLS